MSVKEILEILKIARTSFVPVEPIPWYQIGRNAFLVGLVKSPSWPEAMRNGWLAAMTLEQARREVYA